MRKFKRLSSVNWSDRETIAELSKLVQAASFSLAAIDNSAASTNDGAAHLRAVILGELRDALSPANIVKN